MTVFSDDASAMTRALQLAKKGIGWVEPNPPVGAVVTDAVGNVLGEGYHQKFGGPHAEVHALEAAGEQARGGTIYVTLEPCCHFGQTPPCTQAILKAGIKRVIVACQDPAPHVNGGGITELRNAGCEVLVGVEETEAAKLIAPFVKLFTEGRPFIHAKWAMTLDGKIASRTGHSQWISNPESRKIVHELRGRMDAILVGAGTARSDDPLLTARPPGPRTATRIVVDSKAAISLESQLFQTFEEAPVLIATTESADEHRIETLTQAGAELLRFPISESGTVNLVALMRELGQRKFTNVLVEGGGAILGSLFDADLIDECHVFLAPKIVGGAEAPSPIQGSGLPAIPEISQFENVEVQTIGSDVYWRGRLQRSDA